MHFDISCVIPLFNKEGQIIRAIQSVLEQSHPPIEIIVIDDGSSDYGPSMVRNTKNNKIRLITQNNQGVSAARNRGIDEARGQFVAFLDADDTWKPGFLAEISSLIRDFPEAKLFATGYEIISRLGKTIPIEYRSVPRSPWRGVIPDYFQCMVRGKSIVSASAACINRSIALADGFFPKGINRFEDLDLWCRIALEYPIAFANLPLACYNQDSETQASKTVPIREVPFHLKRLQEKILRGEVSHRNIVSVKNFIGWGILFASWRSLKSGDVHQCKRFLNFPETRLFPFERLLLRVFAMQVLECFWKRI